MTDEKNGETAVRRGYDPEEIAQALLDHDGLVTKAAEAVGCDPMTVYRHIDKHEKVEKALKRARQSAYELATSRLLEAVDNGEPWAIRFMLSGGGDGKYDPMNGGMGELDQGTSKRRLKSTLTGQNFDEDDDGTEVIDAEIVDDEDDA